jgi:hypothetical protein
MVGLDKSAFGCVPGRHSVGRRLEAFDDEAPQPIGVETEPVPDPEAGLGERAVGQSHLAPPADDGLTGTSELALALGRSRCGAG